MLMELCAGTPLTLKPTSPGGHPGWTKMMICINVPDASAIMLTFILRGQGGHRIVSSSVLEVAPGHSQWTPDVSDHICPYFKTRNQSNHASHAEEGGVCHLKGTTQC